MERGNEALQRDTKGIFRFNPGIEQKSVPDYNPYTIRRCRDCDIAKGKQSLAKCFIPDNELCDACKFIRSCEKKSGDIQKVGNGSIEISDLVNREDSDFNKLMDVAKWFANKGESVVLTPKMTRPAQFEYDCIYGDLKGTKYYGKCPDLKIGNFWYEHEGFVSNNPKRAFNNMLNHGLKQSDRIIIDCPDLTERYMSRSIVNRICNGANITEVLLRNADGSLTGLYKKTDG